MNLPGLNVLAEQLCSHFPDEIVVIGGFALHVYDSSRRYRDLGLVVTAKLFSSLKKRFEITKGQGAGEWTLSGELGHKVNVYPEGEHSLRIPFGELAAGACQFGRLRVACLEHLLLLKLAAVRNSSTSQIAGEQLDDVVWLACIIGQYQENTPILDHLLNDDDFRVLELARPRLLGTNGGWILVK